VNQTFRGRPSQGRVILPMLSSGVRKEIVTTQSLSRVRAGEERALPCQRKRRYDTIAKTSGSPKKKRPHYYGEAERWITGNRKYFYEKHEETSCKGQKGGVLSSIFRRPHRKGGVTVVLAKRIGSEQRERGDPVDFTE